jgi:hypothetical protein
MKRINQEETEKKLRRQKGVIEDKFELILVKNVELVFGVAIANTCNSASDPSPLKRYGDILLLAI